MHEMGLTIPLIEMVNRQAQVCNASSVSRVNLRIGLLRDVVDSLMQDCFHHFAQGTPAEHAELRIEYVPVRVTCDECHSPYSPSLPLGRTPIVCPECGSATYSLVTGREFMLESIELEPDTP